MWDQVSQHVLKVLVRASFIALALIAGASVSSPAHLSALDPRKFPKGSLRLEDGTTFEGYAISSPPTPSTHEASEELLKRIIGHGELVFSTAHTGYVESLTDPSFAGQILVLTFPQVGNYGVPPPPLPENKESLCTSPPGHESSRIQVAGLIISSMTDGENWESVMTLRQWLNHSNIPAIAGIDTRALVEHIREKGNIYGRISTASRSQPDFRIDENQNLVARVSHSKLVSCPAQEVGEEQKARLVVLDLGVKYSILRELRALTDRQIDILPWDTDLLEEYKRESFAGLVISNGPGDPRSLLPTVVAHVQNLIINASPDSPFYNMPILGICLGYQVLALASGVRSTKLPYGHRGHNHPVVDLATNSTKGFITSQNHGFAMDSFPKDSNWKMKYINLQDNTGAGVEHTVRNILGVQFHPEGGGGPTQRRILERFQHQHFATSSYLESEPSKGRYSVKRSVFSFNRLPGAEILKGITMKSTGEVATSAENFPSALLSSLDAAAMPFPTPPLSSGEKAHVYLVYRNKAKTTIEENLAITRLLSKLGYTVLTWRVAKNRSDISMMIDVCASGSSTCRDAGNFERRQLMLELSVPIFTDAKVVLAALHAWDSLLMKQDEEQGSKVEL